MNAIKPIAEISLWCVRGGRVIPFIASVSSPYEDENGEDWRCKVSLGDILEHHISSLRQVNSMLALVAAIQFIATFLKKRSEMGDEFYFDAELSEKIDDVSELFLMPEVT